MIHILTGRVDSGKTTLLRQVLDKLGDVRRRVDGFLTEKVYQNGKPFGYDLINLRTGETTPFIRCTPVENGAKVGRFYFLPEGLEKGIRIVLRHQTFDYLVIDEVGPLELGGRGLWPALSQQIRRSGFRGLLVIRIGLVDAFLPLFQGIEVRVFDVQEKSAEADIITAICEAWASPSLKKN